MLAVFGSNNASCISFSDPAFHTEQPKLLVIALEECAPPPRASHPPTTLYSDSYASSSSSSSYESECDSEASSEDEDEACTSYCSSDDAAPDAAAATVYLDDTFHHRMHRIEKWRDMMLSSDDSARSPSPSPQKRKADSDDETGGVFSPAFPRKHPRSTHSLGALSCPACDADFTSAQGLRMHGRASSSANDACRVAVEYNFEK